MWNTAFNCPFNGPQRLYSLHLFAHLSDRVSHTDSHLALFTLYLPHIQQQRFSRIRSNRIISMLSAHLLYHRAPPQLFFAHCIALLGSLSPYSCHYATPFPCHFRFRISSLVFSASLKCCSSPCRPTFITHYLPVLCCVITFPSRLGFHVALFLFASRAS